MLLLSVSEDEDEGTAAPPLSAVGLGEGEMRLCNAKDTNEFALKKFEERTPIDFF